MTDTSEGTVAEALALDPEADTTLDDVATEEAATEEDTTDEAAADNDALAVFAEVLAELEDMAGVADEIADELAFVELLDVALVVPLFEAIAIEHFLTSCTTCCPLLPVTGVSVITHVSVMGPATLYVVSECHWCKTQVPTYV